MSRKRDKPYFSGNDRAPLPKRRRPHPPPAPDDNPAAKGKTHPPASVVVMGLSPDCSVLDLKSRFEIYGAISRVRIDGVGYVTFRSRESAEAAVAAALDDSFGITVDSKRVQVLWATDPLAKWREGIKVGVNKSNDSSPSSGSASKLVRGELPLRRHGRGKKLASAIVNPRNDASNSSTSEAGGSASASASTTLDVPFRGREIVAYDDIL